MGHHRSTHVIVNRMEASRNQPASLAVSALQRRSIDRGGRLDPRANRGVKRRTRHQSSIVGTDMSGKEGNMKRSTPNTFILLALGIIIFTIVEDAVGHRVRDHRGAQHQVRDHRDARPQTRVPARRAQREPTSYRVSWFKPRRVPADLERWLNTRMRGFALVSVARDDTSGRYNAFFKKLPQRTRPWNYKVVIVRDASKGKVLNRAPALGWRLLAATSEWHGARGLHYIYFFRQL